MAPSRLSYKLYKVDQAGPTHWEECTRRRACRRAAPYVGGARPIRVGATDAARRGGLRGRVTCADERRFQLDVRVVQSLFSATHSSVAHRRSVVQPPSPARTRWPAPSASSASRNLRAGRSPTFAQQEAEESTTARRPRNRAEQEGRQRLRPALAAATGAAARAADVVELRALQGEAGGACAEPPATHSGYTRSTRSTSGCAGSARRG